MFLILTICVNFLQSSRGATQSGDNYLRKGCWYLKQTLLFNQIGIDSGLAKKFSEIISHSREIGIFSSWHCPHIRLDWRVERQQSGFMHVKKLIGTNGWTNTNAAAKAVINNERFQQWIVYKYTNVQQSFTVIFGGSKSLFVVCNKKRQTSPD